MTALAHLSACVDLISDHEAAAGARMFLGRPDRWHEKPGPLYRCPNDHVSSTILKSEVKGDLCLACNENVRLTFPEDVGGPLVHPALATCGARSVLGGQCRKPKDHPGRKHSDAGFHDWDEEPADADAYVIECVQGVRGDCALWWRPSSCGYTTDLNAAGRYTKVEAERICRGSSDREERMYRLADVQPLARAHVDRCALLRLPGQDARNAPPGALVTCEHCPTPHPKDDDHRPCRFPKFARTT